MLAKLRRVIIAARFLPATPGQPAYAEIRAVHQAWASASHDLAKIKAAAAPPPIEGCAARLRQERRAGSGLPLPRRGTPCDTGSRSLPAMVI